MGGGRPGPLIALRTYEPSQVDARCGYRRERYHRRVVAQKREIRRARREAGLSPCGSDGWAKPSRRAWCGHARRFGSVSLKVMEGEHGPHAHFSGVQHCGSVWACPVCAPIIRRERAGEIAEGARRHIEAGGGIAMATFTVQHGRSDRLRDSMRVLADAYADMSRSRAFKDFRAERGMVGTIVALEVTFGAHGWHPHRHILMLFDRPVSREEEAGLKRELFAMWEHAVERAGGRPVDEKGFDVRAISSGEEAVASYVTKVVDGVEGIGAEVSLADVKAGRVEGSVNPFQLLDVDTPEAEGLWNEYVDATKGRSAIRWSRGLRDALGMGRERTDEEIADELDARGEVVALVDRELFERSVARDHVRACLVLEAAERGDMGSVRRLLYEGDGRAGFDVVVTLEDGRRVPMICADLAGAA